MVLPKVQISSKIRDKLGEEGVSEVTACLWPVDCQTCNRPLGTEPPALLIDDMLMFASATLHHRRCQSSNWREGGHRHSGGKFVTWRARTVMLGTENDGGPDPRAMLLVNPGMEMVILEPDDQRRWRVSMGGASFQAAGLRPPGEEFVVDKPLPGITGHVTARSLVVAFQVPTLSDGYEAPAERRFRGRARELGGFVLGITHAVNPDTLTVDQLIQIIKAKRLVMGWIGLAS